MFNLNTMSIHHNIYDNLIKPTSKNQFILHWTKQWKKKQYSLFSISLQYSNIMFIDSWNSMKTTLNLIRIQFVSNQKASLFLFVYKFVKPPEALRILYMGMGSGICIQLRKWNVTCSIEKMKLTPHTKKRLSVNGLSASILSEWKGEHEPCSIQARHIKSISWYSARVRLHVIWKKT